jgi:IclR family acetate operon transcriptional repressor
MPDPRATPRDSGSVQSLDRAFKLLEHLADANGEAGITQLTRTSGLPLPTVHRLLRSLIKSGYVRQGASRRYSLGPRLIRLGEVASHSLGLRVQPQLDALAQATGETSNMALLDGDEMVYVAQSPSKYPMRMFIEVGRRVHAHCTAVGKALLAQLPDGQVLALLARTGMPASTPNTVTDPRILLQELENIRQQGYAIDSEEQEVGVLCVAAAIPVRLARVAISVSGPPARLDAAAIERIIPLLKNATAIIGASIALPEESA